MSRIFSAFNNLALYVILIEIAVYASDDMYLPALPMIALDFGASISQAQATLLCWFLGGTLVQAFAGLLSEYVGRRRLLLSGITLFVVTSLLSGMATCIEHLLIFRFLQGASLGPILNPAYSFIHERFSGVEAVKILALISSVTILAPGLSPVLGGWITMTLGWPITFYLLAGIASLGWLGFYYTTRGLEEVRAPRSIGAYLADYAHLLKHRTFMSYILAYASLIGIFFSWLTESPFIVIHTFQETPFVYGLVQLGTFMGFFIGAQLTHRYLKEDNIKTILFLGFSLITLALVTGYYACTTWPSWLLIPTACMCVSSLGTALMTGLLSRLAMESSSIILSAKIALQSTVISLFGLLATGLINLAGNNTFSHLFLLMGIFLSLALSSLLLMRRQPIQLSKKTSV